MLNVPRMMDRNALSHRMIWYFVATAAVWLFGCEVNPLGGAKIYPVKGKVLLPDRKPLTSGQVVFVAAKSAITWTANIDSNGGFVIKGSLGEGLPEGDYRIRIEAGTPTTAARGSAERSKLNLPFPSKYLDEDTSELTVTVT